jgi:two-component system capsular synthesis response regulator RcsB
MEKTIRVLAADDHPVILLAIRLALSSHRNIVLTSQASNAAEIMQKLDALPHDVLLTDFLMPGRGQIDGLSMLAFLRERHPQLPIVVLTMLSNPSLLKSILKFDVSGIVSKADGTIHLADAILSASAGHAQYVSPMIEALIRAAGHRERTAGRNVFELTVREAEVLRLYASGQTVSDIAGQFERSVKTVSAQKKTAMRKLGLSNDEDFFRFAQTAGFERAPDDDS